MSRYRNERRRDWDERDDERRDYGGRSRYDERDPYGTVRETAREDDLNDPRRAPDTTDRYQNPYPYERGYRSEPRTPGGESTDYRDYYGRRGTRTGMLYDSDNEDYARGETYRGGYERRPERRPPPPPPRGASRSHVRCRDIMTRDVTYALRETTIEEVARMMRDEDTGVIPVVERPGMVRKEASGEEAQPAHQSAATTHGNGKLVGLITDRDIVIRAIAEGKDPKQTRAEEIMTTDVHTAQPNDRVIDAIRKMGDKQVRRIPVVDRDGNLRGIISMADVALETEEDQELARALEEISSGQSFWSRIFG